MNILKLIGYNPRALSYPLSQRHRAVADKPKHAFGNAEFKQLVNRKLAPLLQNSGFVGQNYLFYRTEGEKVDIVSLGLSPYGKAVCINIAVMVNPQELEMNENTLTQLEFAHENQGWVRLKPDRDDCWWWFRPTVKENEKVIAEMYKLIVRTGEKFFKNT